MEYILASIFFYALNNLLWKKILFESNMWLIMSLRAFMTCSIGLLIIFFFYRNIFNELTIDTILKVSLASFVGALGLVFMTSALQLGSLRQLGLFNLAGVFFTVTYLYFFENFDLRYYVIGTSLILLGFAVYLIQIKKELDKENSFRQLLLFTLMTIFFSASGLLHWHNLKQSISPIFSLVNQEFIVFSVSFIGLVTRTSYTRKQIIISSMYIYKLVFVMAILIFMAVWTGFLGLKITNPYVTSLLALSTPVLTIVFGALFYKEKWSLSNLIALALIISGAFMLHFHLN
jgi:drug/metabolite transporter (DMT)-like permease